MTSPEYRHEQPGSYIAEHNRRGWQWKVRARVNGSWTRWSEARNFDVAPLDDGPRRSALSAPGVRVLIDASKDGGVWWFPQGQAGFDAAKPHQGGRLATYLREAGCQVRELGRDLADVSGEIKDVDLVIRFGDFQPPTAKEARAYKDFVERGGALLLVAGSRRDPPPPDPIAEAFGLRFERTVGGTAIDRWANHPATQGLGPTPFMAGSVVTKVPNSATPLGWLEEQGGAPKGGWLVMGARNVGKGKVIFLSSQFLLLNVQQPLMDRVFAFLIGKPGQPMSREGATLRGRR